MKSFMSTAENPGTREELLRQPLLSSTCIVTSSYITGRTERPRRGKNLCTSEVL